MSSAIEQLFAGASNDGDSVVERLFSGKAESGSNLKDSRTTESDDIEGKYYEKLFSSDSKGNDSATKTEEEAEVVPTKENILEAKFSKDSSEEAAGRTVFVGNVPSNLITAKQPYKQFKRLFQEHGALESVRFRSIAFAEPLPRKVAFVQHKLHHARDSINAYVVFKEPQSVAKACKALNGSLFEEHHLRVDSVAHPAPQDKKRCVFVGNLHFEADEESLWRHFGSCGKIEYVRIVRDSKTNVGKGFAYVQFEDLSNVNQALLLDGKKLEASDTPAMKRKLRVSRCKNIVRKDASSGRTKAGAPDQRTKLGRANKMLSKAERSKLRRELTVEGQRASKSDSTAAKALGKRKKQRSSTGRVTKRSIAYKKSHQTV